MTFSKKLFLFVPLIPISLNENTSVNIYDLKGTLLAKELHPGLSEEKSGRHLTSIPLNYRIKGNRQALKCFNAITDKEIDISDKPFDAKGVTRTILTED